MFMVGGPSHIDTFDPKPELVRQHGQSHNFGGSQFKLPSSRRTAQGLAVSISAQWPVRPARIRGSSELATCADDLCVVRSLHTDTAAHSAACLEMNTGYPRPGFPSMGAWLTYGLGHSNQNLPGFVVFGAETPPFGGRMNWSSGFLPRRLRRHRVCVRGRRRCFNLRPASNSTPDEQRHQLDLLQRLNQQHLGT